jgi:NADPH-dependent curcumin reductase CurA
MADVNRQWLLAFRPEADFDESAFRMAETEIPSPDEDEVLVHNIYMSVDPYMRGRMRAGKSYAKPVEVDGVMEGGAVGEVLESNHPDFAVGDLVEGRLGWQDYAAVSHRAIRKINPDHGPISTSLGVLGMPGMTAYFGTLKVAEAKAGDTLVVSAASGAVGALVGQIGKIIGCKRVVGIAGGPEKCGYVKSELGFDDCLDYREYDNDTAALQAALGKACPDGIDVYFDNVGGWISDAIYPNIAFGARIAICGMISEYNQVEIELAPRITRHLLVNSARVQGFIVSNFYDQWPAAIEEMAGWLRDSKLVYREDVVEGLEHAPRALVRLFTSKNFGKQLVKIRDWNG